MEKLTALELFQLSKTNLRRTMNEIQDRASSILLLNLRWKDMENVLESAQSSVEERLRQAITKESEIGRKEKLVKNQFEEFRIKLKEQFVLKEKDLEKRCRDFEFEKERQRKDLEVGLKQCERQLIEVKLIEKMVKDELEEIGLKEKCLNKFRREYELKEEQFGLEEKALKERCRDLEVTEKGVQKQLEDIKRKEEEFGLKHKDLEAKQKQNEECLREIKLKEKQIEESSVELARKYELQFEDLEYKVKQYDQRFMELKLKEKLVKDQFKQIEAKEQQLELKEKSLELRYQELGAKEKHCDECLRKVKLREKEIEELSAEHRRKYEQQSSELEFNAKKCEQRFRDLDLKEKKLLEWSNELESKSLALPLHPQVKNESAGSLSIKCSIDHSSPAHLRFCVYMDGKDLQMFLNERWKEHDSIGTEVATALQLAADPAKLVLDAMEGFYPPHLSKGDGEFEGDVARRSCILLLEQLMKLAPEVKPHVKNEAMKLAFGWITKMRVESGHELEVLGFLRLLASFQLAGAFDADELVNFLVFVAQHIQTPELFKVLGLGDKITGFIRKLVEKKQHMEAIRFIYAFEKVNEFPPVPVLKDFLSHSNAEARTVLKKGKMAPKAQNEANIKRIADLRAVVKCIEDHKLESECLPHNVKSLKNLIVSLEKVNGSKSLTSPEANPALCTAPLSETSTQQRVGIKRPREFLATEIAGNSPLGATSTPEQQENGTKCPRTTLSQMHCNLDGFPLSDLHSNPERKAVTDYYSWKALVRPGDQVCS
ncbi:hypothetical protein HRI_000177700 [Hibiscus trionum]|uniref:FRIGIDA-like protein n=1 Tax=Hibiscus trionum TaxID=183268 RepID=A0A9W7GU52_HIBTR|nr:hypothetical protein HRI_000177700 [Hibiscus trionum]